MTTNTTSTIAIETLNKALKIAVESNNLELIQWIFSQGTPSNLNESIAIAVEKSYTDMVTILTKKVVVVVPPKPRQLILGTQKLKMNTNGYTATSNCQLMETLFLDNGSDQALQDLNAGLVDLSEINHKNSHGWTVLMYLARNAKHIKNSDKLVQKLIDLGADVNLKNSSDYPALWLASCNTVEHSTENVVEMLVKHPKIDINITFPSGDSLLTVAAYHSINNTTPKTVEILLSHPDINVNHRQPGTQKTPVSLVANGLGVESSKKVLEMLLKHPKIDISLKDFYGKTVVDYLLPHLKI